MHLIKTVQLIVCLPGSIYRMLSAASLLRILIYYMLFASTPACKFGKQQPDVNEALTGNWIMLYPDHQRNNEHQTALYARSQDSIVKLMGLKLITFSEKGKFQL